MSLKENDILEEAVVELYQELLQSDVEDYILQDFLGTLRSHGLNGLADKLEFEYGEGGERFEDELEDING